MLMAVEDLFYEVAGELFYSPWREDARPLAGLVHALHVFSNVTEFMNAALRYPEFSNRSEDIAAYCNKLNWQLRIGLRQIPDNRMSSEGDRILEEVRRVARSASLRTSEIPEELRSHMLKWKDRYPNLAIAMA